MFGSLLQWGHQGRGKNMNGNGMVTCEDGIQRPPWALEEPERSYYDTEWGRETHDETELFERLSLEGFQSGLSWAVVLRKRESIRRAFAGFNPEAVAAFTEADIERLLQDAGIIRNRRKIEAAIANAAVVLRLREEHPGGLPALLWSFAPKDHQVPAHVDQVRGTSEESHAMAKALKKKGMRFVGPTTCYALMQAVGMVNDRVLGSAPLR